MTVTLRNRHYRERYIFLDVHSRCRFTRGFEGDFLQPNGLVGKIVGERL